MAGPEEPGPPLLVFSSWEPGTRSSWSSWGLTGPPNLREELEVALGILGGLPHQDQDGEAEELSAPGRELCAPAPDRASLPHLSLGLTQDVPLESLWLQKGL